MTRVLLTVIPITSDMGHLNFSGIISNEPCKSVINLYEMCPFPLQTPSANNQVTFIRMVASLNLSFFPSLISSMKAFCSHVGSLFSISGPKKLDRDWPLVRSLMGSVESGVARRRPMGKKTLAFCWDPRRQTRAF